MQESQVLTVVTCFSQSLYGDGEGRQVGIVRIMLSYQLKEVDLDALQRFPENKVGTESMSKIAQKLRGQAQKPDDSWLCYLLSGDFGQRTCSFI